MTPLEQRCIELTHQHKLTHLSSVLNCVQVIADIYETKLQDEPFILGNSHAALALFAVLESKGIADATELLERHGTHAARDLEHDIWVSGGSLGQAETVAVGMAAASPGKRVFLVTSDGCCAEGSVWEALNVAHMLSLENLSVDVVCNGYGAYGRIDIGRLAARLYMTLPWARCRIVTDERYPEWMRGLPGHYLTLTDARKQELLEC